MASKELELIDELKEYLKGTKDYFKFKFRLNKLQQTLNDLELKDKALDKACEILSNEYQYYSKDKWKEYLLKESEKLK